MGLPATMQFGIRFRSDLPSRESFGTSVDIMLISSEEHELRPNRFQKRIGACCIGTGVISAMSPSSVLQGVGPQTQAVLLVCLPMTRVSALS